MKNKKATLALALTAVLAVSAYAPKAHAQQYDSESDFKAELVGNGMTITEYLGSNQVVRIPPRIQDFPVTGIGNKAFAYHRAGITSVTIPNIRKTARFT